MIALDTNVLVAAHRQDSEFHAPARAALTGLAESRGRWAIPWPCVHEFLSVVTHPRIFNPPSSTSEAVAQQNAWLESPTLALLAEDGSYWSTLSELVQAARIAGPRIHDARIAALCLRHGVDELWTADRDFGRFPALRVRNPLVGM
ncbi:MAG: TA system VapC family ribonuclease toxin [Gemmatimonas sp.]